MAELTNNDRILGMIGLCRRAGKLVIGTNSVIDRIQSQKRAFLCIISSDSSERTKKQLIDKCQSHGVRFIVINANGDALAHSIGKRDMIISSVLISEKRIAEKIISLYESEQNDNIS